ncbi:transcriptional coactivator p15/PC4 family protein [Acidobacteria bacterium AH-259-A15]|nr:transcriptional coactivator p15/PC4 family protein [Acidobacteria bacterium AH-259-A15]
MSNNSNTSQVVYEFEKNGLEIVRCSLTQFKGHQLLDVRVFYQDDEGEWRPTRKGIALSTDLVDQLVEGVKQLQEALRG